jgi:hypothetical protein
MGNQVRELLGGAEQERTVNPEDGDVIGNPFVLQHARAAALDILSRHPRHVVVIDTRCMKSSAARKQQDAGHHRAHEEAVEPVFGNDARYDHDERAGGPADLHFRSAECGDREPRTTAL